MHLAQTNAHRLQNLKLRNRKQPEQSSLVDRYLRWQRIFPFLARVQQESTFVSYAAAHLDGCMEVLDARLLKL